MPAEDITKASPDVAVNVSNDHPSSAVPLARLPNRSSSTIIKNRRSRFSELIEPLSFESESAIDDKGTSSSPPTDSDSDGRGPTTCSLSSTKWLLSFASFVLVISTVTISPLKHHLILGHRLWKFAALPLSFFCGLLVSDCIVRFAYLAVPRRRYVLRRMEKAIGTYAWIALITLTWAFCFGKPMTSSDVHKAAEHINEALPKILLTFGFWQVKIVIFETIRVAFYRKRFYERLKGAALDLYMLDALVDREFGEHKQKLDASLRKCVMKKTDEMMEVALNTSRMPRHDADLLLLEYVQGFKESGFKADDQSKILKAAAEAFKRMANQDGYAFIKVAMDLNPSSSLKNRQPQW